MEVYGRLKAAFREYRQLLAAHQPTQAVQQAIIFYAAWLGPLRWRWIATVAHHDSIQRLGGPESQRIHHRAHIHAQFETHYVAAKLRQRFFRAGEGSGADRRSLRGICRLSAEFEHAGGKCLCAGESRGLYGKGSPAAFDFTTHRLAAGSQMLLDLWYTAWMESAVPVPEHPPAPPATK